MPAQQHETVSSLTKKRYGARVLIQRKQKTEEAEQEPLGEDQLCHGYHRQQGMK